ncbi:MAG: GntR family transcriptional regulator [Spirochaetales bacterium]|nr:GntR family transcriptional regulator [Spirochaetales bacterium]
MNFNQDRAIYLQIADHITENILASRWKENDRIPSTRDMAVSIEVNPNTVVRTYAYLQEKGIIQNQRGIGYFVAGDAVERTRELEKEAFINEQLPQLFKTMELLGITLEDIGKLYGKFRKGADPQPGFPPMGEEK